MKLKLSSWVAFILLCFPAFNTYAMQQVPVLKEIINIWGIISLILTVALIYRKHVKLIKIVKWILTFCSVYCFSTLIYSSENLMGAISECLRLILIPLYLVLLQFTNIQQYKEALKKLSTIMSALCLVDVMTVFYQVYYSNTYTGASYSFFGLDNYAAFLIIPMVGIILYTNSAYKKNKQKQAWLVFALCFAGKLSTRCTTAIIAMMVMFFTILVYHYMPQIRKFFSVKALILVISVFVLGVGLFGIQRILTPFLQMIGKDVTMSYRSIMWPRVLAKFVSRPLIGFGKLDADTFKILTGFSVLYDQSASHPHNYLLAILFYTGLAGLLCYVGLLFNVVKNIRALRGIDRHSYILLATVFGFLVLGIADDYIFLPPFYILLTIISIEAQSFRNGN